MYKRATDLLAKNEFGSVGKLLFEPIPFFSGGVSIDLSGVLYF